MASTEETAPTETPGTTDVSGAPGNIPQTETDGVNTGSTPTEASSGADASGDATREMSAFVIGYTGEVGKEVVKELARRNIFKKVFLLGRRTVEYKEESIANNSKIEQVKVDFEDLDKSMEIFQGVDVGFCCLGTTQGKSGKEGLLKVDHDYVVKTAELAKDGGCKQFHLVSSQGANAHSSIYYSKVKGQAEEAVKTVGIPRISIYQPGMLMCEREESRAVEWFFRKLLVPMDYISPGTMTHATHIVAKAMINNVTVDLDKPNETLRGKAIHKLGIQEK